MSRSAETAREDIGNGRYDKCIWRYANWILRSFVDCGGMDRDDVFSEVRLWALQLAVRYDPSRNAKFLTFLMWCLKRRTQSFLNQSREHNGASLVFDSDLVDVAMDHAPRTRSTAAHALLVRVLPKLSDPCRRLLFRILRRADRAASLFSSLGNGSAQNFRAACRRWGAEPDEVYELIDTIRKGASNVT